MNLSPDADQTALLSATADWCQRHMPLEEARSRSPDLWRGMAEMGWFAMTLPAERDGLGLSHADEALAFAELGRFIAPVSALSTAVGARWAEAPAPLALGAPAAASWRILDPTSASEALLIGPGPTAAIGTLPANRCEQECLDLSTRQAHVPLLQHVRPLSPAAYRHLQLLAAAYAVGCADAARDMAAAYARVREQFERPIGWFQSIKHLCADMAVRAAAARSQLYYAACALDAEDSDAAFHIAAAKRLADQAALENARVNVQVHGGVGMTDEAYPHFCLKRAHLLGLLAAATREELLGEAA
jgi:alkylation response protein AidB-like acyl-CoA dehydrogenase